MRELLLSYNPETGRCHGVTPGCLALQNPALVIHIHRVPNGVTLPEVCMLVEKNPAIRQQRQGRYEDLCRKGKTGRALKKAG